VASETTGGFGRTFGSIAAIVAAVALAVGGYFAFMWVRKAKDSAADKTIVTADSLQRTIEAVQRVADLVLAKERDSLTRLVVNANTRTVSAQQLAGATRLQLEAQRSRADSAEASAKNAPDSAAAAELARPPSLDSMIGILAAQHAADSGATAAQAHATSSCQVSLTGCALGRARADSIAGFWQTKYNAEKKKIVPKWQSITISVLEALGVAVATKLILK
jgi:hypothetical protein